MPAVINFYKLSLGGLSSYSKNGTVINKTYLKFYRLDFEDDEE